MKSSATAPGLPSTSTWGVFAFFVAGTFFGLGLGHVLDFDGAATACSDPSTMSCTMESETLWLFVVWGSSWIGLGVEIVGALEPDTSIAWTAPELPEWKNWGWGSAWVLPVSSSSNCIRLNKSENSVLRLSSTISAYSWCVPRSDATLAFLGKTWLSHRWNSSSKERRDSSLWRPMMMNSL